MQEMQHPNGAISREFFTDAELKRGEMKRRRRELESEGYTFSRIAYIVKPNKFTAHQGKGEIARRARQQARDEANRAKREAATV
jgi:hypothetical protein